jgi:hypothetical protein
MTGIMGVNRVGLKRRPTFEEIINTENFKPKYPDRSYKFLRNSPQMTQFDNMSMFEFDDYFQRERVQRQMHDLMSSIAESSNLTVDKLKAVTQAIGKLKPKLDMGDEVDMEGAQAELTAQQEEIYQQQLEKIRQGKALLRQDLAGSIQDDPVQTFLLHGQGSSSDQPTTEHFTTDPEDLGTSSQLMEETGLTASQIIEQSGLTSGIMAEARLKTIKDVDKYVLDLRLMKDRDLNKELKDTGLPINLRNTSKEDKILNLVQHQRGFRGPPLSIIDIISRSYAEPNSTG